MSESKDNHAFPTEDYKSEGLSKAEYAAIHLKVPMSGTAWLDEMIEASRRDEFTKAAMQAYLTRDINLDLDDDTRAAWSLDQADALIAASNKRKEGE